MAAVLEAALERDPVRSRNTLDDEDELEAQQRRAFMGPLEAEFELQDGKSMPEDVSLALIATTKPIGDFVRLCFVADSVVHIGRIIAPNHGKFGPEGLECQVSVVQPESKGPAVVLFSFDNDGFEECSSTWASALFKSFKSKPGRVLVLDLLGVTSYACNGERAHPPFIRSLCNSEEALADAESFGLSPLETGNIVTGLGAAVLTESLFLGHKGGIGVLSLRDAVLGTDSLTAFLPVLVEALASCDFPKEFLRDLPSVKGDATQIHEIRAVDREMFYT
mmetsp:Transcript_14780/g.26459  ORF Transcript_14780/g.26459 Transcript_14780/m.26459 type:complete len:278 (-) Transcript_14780:22-855(-)